jgi:hypothetical protein
LLRLTAQRAPSANQDIQMMKHRDPLREQRYLRLARACFFDIVNGFFKSMP